MKIDIATITLLVCSLSVCWVASDAPQSAEKRVLIIYGDYRSP